MAKSSVVAAENELRKIKVNKGLIAWMSLPSSWERQSSDNHQPTWQSPSFHKRRAHWTDCYISVSVEPVSEITTEKSRALKQLPDNQKLSPEQVMGLKDLPAPSDYRSFDYAKSRIIDVRGQRLVVVQYHGKCAGPCEPLRNGGSRRILLNYVRGTAWVLVESNKVQSINFDADTSGDEELCMSEIAKVLESIVWTR